MTVTRHLQVIEDDQPVAAIRVAFATSDRETVDQHFGSAESFSIYAVNPEQAWLLQVTEFGHLKQDGNEDKLTEKFTVLQDCVAVYCRACGASAVRQLLALGIQPVKVSDGVDIQDLLNVLKQELRDGPSGWLAKAMRSQILPSDSRFDDMEAEGWSE